MPSSREILDTAAGIANDWRPLAIAWHVYFAALFVVLLTVPGLARRVRATLLVAPLVSVSALAWTTGNWFNGGAFAILAISLAGAASRMSVRAAMPTSLPMRIAGALCFVFAFVYPHFLRVDSWMEFVYASPLGLLPCPTLTALIGLSLMFGLLRDRRWEAVLSAAGLLYGTIGVFRLGVTIDLLLLGGAILLAGAMTFRSARWRSVRADRREQEKTLPGDELISDRFGAFTHAITIHRPPRDVWPWIAQMGAGTRAGWYSYDFLDNGRRPSASRIVSEWQRLEPGMIFRALPKITEGFTLLAFERDRFLTLGWRSPSGQPTVTWTFSLEDAPGGSTRLVVRAAGGGEYRFHGLPPRLSRAVVRVVHFIMQRKQLLGIARRAEMPAAA